MPVSALSILNKMFSVLASDDKFNKLSLSKDNWPKWLQKILQVMKVSELDDYLYGLVVAPDGTTDPLSFKNWKGNNK
jgi:hypothetical protein